MRAGYFSDDGDFEEWEHDLGLDALPDLGQQDSLSMPLVPIDEITTTKLAPLEQVVRLTSVRRQAITSHERFAAQLQATLDDIQRGLDRQAEEAGEVYTRWVLIHVQMCPTLEQIGQMRGLNQKLMGVMGFMMHLRRSYEATWGEMQRHAEAAERLRVATTGRPV